jgi:hypothetical protein
MEKQRKNSSKMALESPISPKSPWKNNVKTAQKWR